MDSSSASWRSSPSTPTRTRSSRSGPAGPGRRCSTRPSSGSPGRTATTRRPRPGRPSRRSRSAAASRTSCPSTCSSTAPGSSRAARRCASGSIGLLAFTDFQPETHQPYYLHLYWGQFDFRGVLDQADVTYTLFDRNGEPLRATVKLSLKEALAPNEVAAEERAASPDLYQTWLVADGDTLDGIAERVYGDAGLVASARRGQRAAQTRGARGRPGADAAAEARLTWPSAIPTDAVPTAPRSACRSTARRSSAPCCATSWRSTSTRRSTATPACRCWCRTGTPTSARCATPTDGPFVPGKPIAVSLGYHAELTPVFSGVITADRGPLSQRQRDDAPGGGPFAEHPARRLGALAAVRGDDRWRRRRRPSRPTTGCRQGGVRAVTQTVVHDRRSDWEALVERAEASAGWPTFATTTWSSARRQSPPATSPS